MENKFNLVYEPWIPVTFKGIVSLKQIFEDHSIEELSGNAIQKISILKLLLAISQTAYTPQAFDDLIKLEPVDIAKKSIEYLEKNKDLFWLYGNKPFLQMPQICSSNKIEYEKFQYHISTSTILYESQINKIISDAEKAQLLIALMSFSLGGKKNDKTIILSKNNYEKRTASCGPSLGFKGYLHNFIISKTIISTIYLNLLSKEQIDCNSFLKNSLGVAPWEKMPQSEDCEIANDLKQSYMSKLIPINRFVFLSDQYMNCTEGIRYLTYKEGQVDLSIALNNNLKEPKVLWTNPEKKPWREITSLLSFIQTEKTSFLCPQLVSALKIIKEKQKKFPKVKIWSGGLNVKSSNGEQFVTGKSGFVESKIELETSWIVGEQNNIWFTSLKQRIEFVELVSKKLLDNCRRHFKKLGIKNDCKKIENVYWQTCEKNISYLLENCEDIDKINKVFVKIAYNIYDEFCYSVSARQLDSWALNRPKF